MELFIIRHGQSIGNLITEDMADGELTELGRQQALRVCEGMKTANIEHIVASPLMRAIESLVRSALTRSTDRDMEEHL